MIQRHRIPCLSLLLVLAVFIAYSPSLRAPFLSDDYIHLTNASTESVNALVHRILIVHPSGGDMFFRPMGSLYYWLIFRLAAFNPLTWHASSIAIHAANTVLVFLLAGRLCQRTFPSLIAAALFAWHAAHVEDVCWLAAAFDLLAAFFVLVVLLLVTQPQLGPVSHALLIASSALACLSKESAYCLPLLVVCLALFLKEGPRRQMMSRAPYAGAACCGVFVYRLWFLQGFGGYRTASGQSIALTLSPLSALQALTLRIWGILFIPVNWSQKPTAWFATAAIAMLISLAVVAAQKSWMIRPNLAPAILFVLAAALPALPLLLIGSDLAGSRVLYIPSIGLSLLWMLIIQAIKKQFAAIVLSSSTLLFQLSALLQNQHIWVKVAETAKQACLDTAHFQKQNSDAAISVYELPATIQGVYFFLNGLPQCVALSSGIDAAKIQLLPAGASNSNARAVRWNSTTGQIELVKR